MMAYEMVGVADQNNRTYESKYGTYNRETGFVLNEVGRSIGKCGILDKMFHENCWSLKQEKQKPKKMTKEEIEEALGYEIEIDDEDKTDKRKKYNIKLDQNNQTTNQKNNSVILDDTHRGDLYSLDDLIRRVFDLDNYY